MPDDLGKQTFQYEYEAEADRKQDDRYEHRARDLARAGIYDEARRVAGKMRNYQRSCDVLDDISRQRRRSN